MIQFFYNRKGKRGISTVLGVLLMVGILFTTIIPIYIYVNAVNNYYDRTVVDMKIADQERSMEDLDVYAWGSSDTGDDIDVFLENKGSVSLNVVHIWAMRIDLVKTLIFTSQNVSSLPLQINPSNQATVGNLSLSTILESNETDYFNIEVTTARGNKFPSKTNPLHHNGGGWVSSSNPPWIQVIIRSSQDDDNYRVEAVCVESGESYPIEAYKVHGSFSTIILVKDFGSYNVTVWNIGPSPQGKINYKVGSRLLELYIEMMDRIAYAPFNDQ